MLRPAARGLYVRRKGTETIRGGTMSPMGASERVAITSHKGATAMWFSLKSLSS